MTPPFEVWYEFASTYSYLTLARIGDVVQKNRLPVIWRPFLLGPIFKESGWNDSPFNVYPAEGRHMWRDMERRCADRGVPFRKPSQFPRNGVLAARVALYGADKPWCLPFSVKVYEANFALDRDIQEETIAAILGELKLDAPEILKASLSDDNKAALRRQTERARALGIFGAPSFTIGDELFWGDDRLEDAAVWHKNPR